MVRSKRAGAGIALAAQTASRALCRADHDIYRAKRHRRHRLTFSAFSSKRRTSVRFGTAAKRVQHEEGTEGG